MCIRDSNKRFVQQLERRSQPFRRAIQTDTMSRDKADDLVREVYADTVILSWETKVEDEWRAGIENPEGGELLAFNRENVLLTLKNLPDLFSDIQEQASKVSLYRQELLEADAGN